MPQDDKRCIRAIGEGIEEGQGGVMSKKSDDAGIALAFMLLIGLVVSAAAAVYGIGKLIWWGIQHYRNRHHPRPAVQQKQNSARTNRGGASQNLKYNHFTLTKHHPETGELIVETDWEAQFQEIDRARYAGDYDFARMWLQKFANYITGNEHVSQGLKDRFKLAMTAFAKEDPLYCEVIKAVRFVVMNCPGLLQTKTYQLFPHHDQESIRYVLYFAHELGDITRRKKGRSYELFLPSQLVDGEVIEET